MCWVLEIRFFHSSLQLTVLNDAPCSRGSKLSLHSAKCPDADNGGLPSGNGEEMSYNPLLQGEGNWEGLI